MSNPYRKLFYDEQTKQYSFEDFTYDKEKHHTNIECINIIKENGQIQNLQFGHYSDYKFFVCPIWMGKILCHTLKSDNRKFTLGFSYFTGTLLSYFEIDFSLKNENDDVLAYTFSLINFLNLIATKEDLFPLGYTIDVFRKCNFNNLLFRLTMTDLFKVLQKGQVKRRSEKSLTFTLEQTQKHINSLYFYKLISEILTNEAGLKNSGLNTEHEIEIFLDNRENSNLDLGALEHQDVEKKVKEVILFYFPVYFKKAEFILENFKYQNTSKELIKSMMDFSLLR